MRSIQQRCALAGVVAALAPTRALAQVVTGSVSGCGAYATAFNGMIQGTNALATFFYGPFFKVGCLVAFAVAAVVLLFDDGQLGRVAQWIVRGVLVVAFVLGAASFLNIGNSSC